jgi:hypothetical protein
MHYRFWPTTIRDAGRPAPVGSLTGVSGAA